MVQLYVHQDVASVSRPVRELKGIRRVHLKPGERINVQFSTHHSRPGFLQPTNAIPDGTWDVPFLDRS